MPRRSEATCPGCGLRFRKNPQETEGERAARIQVHRGTGSCRAHAEASKMLARDMCMMQSPVQYRAGYHELKAADLIERRPTRFERGITHHEMWGPRWALEYALFMRKPERGSASRTFNERVAELRELAADPDGPDRARAMMVLSGHDPDAD